MTLPDRRIVKVQISVFGTLPVPRVLMYDESRQWMREDNASRAIIGLMAGRKKAFFYATIGGSGAVNLEGGAPWQGW